MNIINNPKPYIASPSKLARVEVRQELARFQAVPDLREQNLAGRVPVPIGNHTTYWSKGISSESPIFVQHSVSGIKRIHILAPDRRTVGVFDSGSNADTWERRALLRSSEEILASLPKKALTVEVTAAPATDKQLAVLRKMLDLPSTAPMPPLGTMAASRLIDRITVERVAAALFVDVKQWLAEPTFALDDGLTAA